MKGVLTPLNLSKILLLVSGEGSLQAPRSGDDMVESLLNYSYGHPKRKNNIKGEQL